MTLRSIARRYADALIDVVGAKNGEIDRAAEELAAFRDLVENHGELRLVLEAPSVPAQKKRAIVEAVLLAAGATNLEVRRLLLLLADRGRLALLPVVATTVAERVLQAKRIVPAAVVTAVPLGDDRRDALSKALGKATGYDVTITNRVDPSIVGGVVAQVGSIVFDGSVTGQIARMKHRLLAGA
jgi:F-type H+-transporting ATPase subunit delta